jgi:riboflavin synthase
MFTGLVQDVGSILKIERGQDSSRIQVQTRLANELSIGDSISINGVCLTAVSVEPNFFVADVMIQTLKLSNLGNLEEGNKVNAELAARLDTRLGGHIVQGHVDDIGEVVSNKPGDKWHEFVIKVPTDLCKYIVNQGSICVDGVSLTVGEINDATYQMTLWLIPETLAKTTLGDKQSGDQVNLEVDVLAKYVERLVMAQNSKIESQKGDNS